MTCANCCNLKFSSFFFFSWNNINSSSDWNRYVCSREWEIWEFLHKIYIRCWNPISFWGMSRTQKHNTNFFSPFPPRRTVIEESWLVHYRYMFALCNVSKVSEETKNDLIKSQTYNVAGNMIWFHIKEQTSHVSTLQQSRIYLWL